MDQGLRFGPYRFDPRRGLWHGRREVRLPPRVLAVLDLLLARAGEVVSKDDLHRVVWQGTVVSDAALTSCVQHLRRALQDDARAPRYVETLHRRGYRFIGRPATASGRALADGAHHQPPSSPAVVAASRDAPRHVPLVGRDAEIDRLMGVARASGSGQLHVALLVGELGVGKTRLAGEIARRFEQDGGRVVIGHAYESEQIVPYGPWIDGIETSGVLTDHGLVRNLPDGCRAALARLLPALGPGGPLSGPEHHRTLFEAVAVLFRTLAERPLLVVLEDLHWADEMTVRLLLFLARRLRDAPVLVLTSVREEEVAHTPVLRMLQDELRGETSFVRLTLQPLSRCETTMLARHVARAGGAMDEAILQTVWRASEGNPLVAIETMRGLEDSAVAPAVEAAAIPPRIQELITARLERLPGPARTLALAAAVIGRPFEFALVHHASGLPESDAVGGIEALVQRRVLRVRDERFEFSHDRVRQAILAGLLPGRRASLHAAVARSLVHVYAGRLEPHHAPIAIHAREGGLPAVAVEHFRAAGRQALARYARREAAECFREALAAIDALPDDAERAALAFDVRIELRSAIRWLGELAAVARLLDEAEDLAERLGDRRRRAWVDAYRANDGYMRGRPHDGVRCGRRAQAAAAELGDAALSVLADLYTGLALYGVGDYRQAAESLERASASSGEGNRREVLHWIGPPAVVARGVLSLVLGELGEFERGATVGRQALAAAEADHLPYCRVQSALCLAGLHMIRGELDVAAELLERGALVAAEWEVGALAAQTRAARGFCLALSGRVAEGLALLEAARQQAEAVHLTLPFLLNWLGEAYLLDGQAQRALDVAARSVTLAREQGERASEAWALRLLGEIRMHEAVRDDVAAATHLHDALALATDCGMQPLVAHCLAGVGRHGRLTGAESAELPRRRAVALYAELGMTRRLL